MMTEEMTRLAMINAAVFIAQISAAIALASLVWHIAVKVSERRHLDMDRIWRAWGER